MERWDVPTRGNRHSNPCHPPFDPDQLAPRTVKKFFLGREQSPRAPPANRHGISQGVVEAGADVQQQSDKHKRPSSATASTTSSPTSLATRTAGLCITRSSVRIAGGALQRLELGVRWCPLQQQLHALSLQAPTLEVLHLTVTEPLDPRWAPDDPGGPGPTRQTLDLHSGTAVRFPSLKSLVLECLPVKSLHFSASALPRLRHLRLSCSGHLLSLAPYQSLSWDLPSLEALEVVEVAVWAHVDLTALSICPALRLVSLTELWVLDPVYNTSYAVKAKPGRESSGQQEGAPGSAAASPKASSLQHSIADGRQGPLPQAEPPSPQQPQQGQYQAGAFRAPGQRREEAPSSPGQASKKAVVPCFVHELQLPACRVLHIRNSLNALGFELWVPQMKALHLLCTKMLHLRLMERRPQKGTQPASVTVLRGMVDEESMLHLRRHPLVGQLFFDDDAQEQMKAAAQALQSSIHYMASASRS